MKHLSIISLRGLASILTVAALLVIAVSFGYQDQAVAAKAQPAATPAATPAAAPEAKPAKKDEAINSIDSRIQNLQNTRDCIDKAQTNKGVETCRAGLKRK